MLLLLLACAEPDSPPKVISPDPTARLDLRLDMLPGAWPNRLPADGTVEVAAIASEVSDPFALHDTRLVAWDRSTELVLVDAPTARDVDGDGTPDAVWTVSAGDLRALLPGDVGRIGLEGTVNEADAYGWDLLVDTDATVAVLPEPTGPYPVGTLLTSADADGREDPLTETGRPRILPVQVWYPAETAPAAQPGASYLNQAESELAAAFLALPSDHFQRVIGHAVVGAPVQWVPPVEAWPVVLLTPGDGPVAAHTALASELASHGFVVIGVNPPFSGLPVLLADGTDATAPERDSAVSYDEVASVWVEDVSQLIDTAARWTDTDLRFEELLATDRVAHVGTGLGGAAGIEACRADNRLLGCVDLDGEPLDASTAGNTAPALLILSTGTRFADAPTRETVLAGTLSPSWGVELPSSGPDALWDLGLHGPLLDGRSVRTGTLSAEEGFAETAAYTLDFLDLILRDGAGARLAAGGTEVAVVTAWSDD
jgi:predicted dienelactone hydrolase